MAVVDDDCVVLAMLADLFSCCGGPSMQKVKQAGFPFAEKQCVW